VLVALEVVVLALRDSTFHLREPELLIVVVVVVLAQLARLDTLEQTVVQESLSFPTQAHTH
jgi:hypothetical protein